MKFKNYIKNRNALETLKSINSNFKIENLDKLVL